MNIFDEHPFKVILDYGHNPPAVQAMANLVRNLDVDGRRIVVMAAPGDRRDEDVRQIATHCAGIFDHYICRRDDNPRGRGDDEVPRMQRDALLAAGVDAAAIEVIPAEAEAVDRALRLAGHGDLVLIFGDDVARSWGQITGFAAGAEPSAAPPPATAARLAPPAVPAAALAVGEQLIRDERGVRLAREHED
jgi:cyanophycin synthetase